MSPLECHPLRARLVPYLHPEGEDLHRPPQDGLDEEQERPDCHEEAARQGQGPVPAVRKEMAGCGHDGEEGTRPEGILRGWRQEHPGKGALCQGKGDLRSVRGRRRGPACFRGSSRSGPPLPVRSMRLYRFYRCFCILACGERGICREMWRSFPESRRLNAFVAGAKARSCTPFPLSDMRFGRLLRAFQLRLLSFLVVTSNVGGLVLASDKPRRPSCPPCFSAMALPMKTMKKAETRIERSKQITVAQ